MTFQQLSPRYVLTRVVFAALIAATVFVSGARTGAAGATAARPAIGLSAAKVTPLDSICVRYGLEPAVDYTLTVTGTGFKPDEKVAIRMTQFGSSVLARARATGTGTFSATFKDPRQPAALGKVRATGSLGSVATHKITTYFATCYVESNPAPWDGVGWKAGSIVDFRVAKKVVARARANREGSFASSAHYRCGSTPKLVTITGTTLNKEQVVKGAMTC